MESVPKYQESSFEVPVEKGDIYAWQDPTARRSQKSRVAYKILGGLVVVAALIGALAVDPKPIYDKANSILYDGDELQDVNLPSTEEMATEQTSPAEIVIEGSKWASQVHTAVKPVCHHNQTRTLYETDRKTALVTFPRSGNSYIRELVERATGHYTTSAYCDGILAKTFKQECNHDNKFFQKTHFPALSRGRDIPVDAEIAQVVTIIRNPLDCLMSFHSYLTSIANHQAGARHESHAEGTVGKDPEEFKHLQGLVRRWNEFYGFWAKHPVPQLQLRYEDLRNQPLGLMMSLISFLMPEADRPDVDEIVCALELQESTEAYHSAKRSHFASWKQFTPELRRWMVQNTADLWCRFGYDELLREELGEEAWKESGVDCVALRKLNVLAI